MTTDYYAVLGVTPAAETVVISAAYRALMRHYHPDTNRDPGAQAKAREITAAYAVLRDPQKRADYDAQRVADDQLWAQAGSDRPSPPAMRGVGIASALLALALVGAVWAWPQPDQPGQHSKQPQTIHEAPSPALGRVEPVVDLQPESERLARLREETEALSPAPPTTPAPDPPIAAAPILAPPREIQAASADPVRSRPAAPKRIVSTVPRTATKPRAVAAAPAPRNERLATLERMSAGFFTQSMAFAGDTKRDLLVGARDRSSAQRKKCRSDTCVADAYVRQIRETSAIMEGRTGPPK